VIRKEAWPFYRKIPGVAYVGSWKDLKDLRETHRAFRFPPFLEQVPGSAYGKNLKDQSGPRSLGYVLEVLEVLRAPTISQIS